MKPLKIVCSGDYNIPMDALQQALSASTNESVYEKRYNSLEAYRCGVEKLYKMHDNVAPWIELDDILLTSSCAAGGKSGVFSECLEQALVKLNRGVSLVGLASSQKAQVLASFDPCVKSWDAKQQEPFASIIKRFTNQYPAFAVMVHQTPFCSDVDLSSIFQGLDLKRWGELRFRQPYIALVSTQHKTKELLVPDKSAIGIKIIARK